jgi:hypothetical protein
MTAVYLLFPFPSKTTAALVDDVQRPLRQHSKTEREWRGSAIKTERVKVSLQPVIRKRGFHHLNLAVYLLIDGQISVLRKDQFINQSI